MRIEKGDHPDFAEIRETCAIVVRGFSNRRIRTTKKNNIGAWGQAEDFVVMHF